MSIRQGLAIMFHGRDVIISTAASVALALWLGMSTAKSLGQQALPQLPSNGPPAHWVTLPTDRSLHAEGSIPPADLADSGLAGPYLDGGEPSRSSLPSLALLLRPALSFAAEWEPESGGFGLSNYDLSVKMPTFPIFGPPPPFITTGFSFTDLDAPTSANLPTELYDVALGVNWMRRYNDQWMMRYMFSAAFASDSHNTSSDAWQFRGGLFLMYRHSEQWDFVLGALATGRKDIPVVPAIGAVWQPSPDWRVDFTLPRPRVSWLAVDRGHRQYWLYAGGGFTGGTWAYERTGSQDDLLTYREWRAVLGLESTPPRLPGTYRATGLKFGGEIGYVFGRKFEFDSDRPDLKPDDALLMRATIGF